MDEVWVPIPETTYEVSDLGRVRSLPHIDHRGFPWPGKVLKPFRDGKRGYVAVSIHNKRTKVHRLVATAFHTPGPGQDQVNHKNGQRSDNRACNLEWCTAQENSAHSYRELGRKSSGGHKGKLGSANHNSKSVEGKHLETGAVRVFGSTAEAARELGIATGMVPRVCSGKYKHAAGWHFRYV